MISTVYICVFLFVCLHFVPTAHYTKKFQGRYSRDLKDFDVVVPRKVTASGEFLSHTIPHHYKRRSADLEVHYRVPITGEEHHLELRPNHGLLAPGCVTERRTNQSLSGVLLSRVQGAQCHYRGTVRGQPRSTVALSACHGLAGFIRCKRGVFFIEPARDHEPDLDGEHPHLLYRGVDGEKSCGILGEATDGLARRAMGQQTHRTPRETPRQLFMETMVVLDKSVVEYHRQFDVVNYALTAMNIASNLFKDETLGTPINLALVRIILLEEEEDQLNLSVSPDAEMTLNYFCDWQEKMNPGEDSHPNHHDVALLITRTNVCEERRCGLLGLSREAGCCEPAMQCAVVEDCGLKLGFVVAHELAHTLGVSHDTAEDSGCSGLVDGGRARTVMDPGISTRIEQWSLCSQGYIKVFLEGGFGDCLEDEPSDHQFNVVDVLPGVMYDADFQCRVMFSPASYQCDMGSTCDSLNCEVPGLGCLLTNVAPVAGTTCEANKWCFHQKCLLKGERPNAVDGGWSEWSLWSECSRTCGYGVSSMERQCAHPRPARGGRYCSGQHKRYRICIRQPCDLALPTFRDAQCASFNDWKFPEDGRTHSWKAHRTHADNPCALVCRNEAGVVAVLKPTVEDGTSCYSGIRDVCIGGECREIPCDMDLDSHAVEDACGVCHGDGTQCRIKQGAKDFQLGPKGYTLVTLVPEGARNIRVEEVTPSRAHIAVLSKKGTHFYTTGKTLGMFPVPGSRGWLGAVRDHQEVLNIPGPVTEPLKIMVNTQSNATLQYSMGLKVSRRRTPNFTWEFVEWFPCSARCGPGIQALPARCMERAAGLVEDVYCRELDRPRDKTRACDLGVCVPRWMIGDWQECLPTANSSCKRVRVVKCIKPAGEGEGASEVVPSSSCAGTMPHQQEACTTCYSRVVKEADLKLHRGRLIVDKEDEKQLHLQVLGHKSKGNVWSVKGKDALHFIEKIQEQKHHKSNFV